jgi:hypothetical protein
MLKQHCDDGLTDKNTIHSYLEVYEQLFCSKKDTATHVLEIGIGPYQPNGGSIRMWNNYFTKANIHAVDIISIDNVNPILINEPRVYLHTSNDAYNTKFFNNTFLSKKDKYDIVIDDGPHTLESMITFINLYTSLMKDDGILVVEDVQKIEWIDILSQVTPSELQKYIQVFDRRDVKGRYDDIMFVINKTLNV